jgi:hypothetical protein
MSDLFFEPGTTVHQTSQKGCHACTLNFLPLVISLHFQMSTHWALLSYWLQYLYIAKKVSTALKSDTLHLLIDKSAGDWPYTQAKQLAH